MKQFLKDNYQSVVDRGKVTANTSQKEFECKVLEELSEACNESDTDSKVLEVADLVCAAMTWGYHLCGDGFYDALHATLKKNRDRAKKLTLTDDCN